MFLPLPAASLALAAFLFEEGEVGDMDLFRVPHSPLLELSWEIRPDNLTHTLTLDTEGRATLRTVRVKEYRPIADEPIAWAGKRLRESFSAAENDSRSRFPSLFEELRALPRYAHNTSSFAGVKVSLHANRDGESAAHEGFNSHYPALEKLFLALGEEAGPKASSAFDPLLGLSKFRDQKPWEFTPGKTPKEKLLEPLDPPAPDVELRRLALRLAAEAEAYEFLPKLRELFARSKQKDPEGDYFLALALLRLGEIEGAERVLAVAQSAHPEWALEASGALEAAFADAYGKRVIPPYDFFSPGDPRPEAAEAFRAWLRERRPRLEFEPKKKRYREREEKGI